MINTINKASIFAFALLIFCGGCSESNMPEVNNKNCQMQNIKKLEPESLRKEFYNKCYEENPFKPSTESRGLGPNDFD